MISEGEELGLLIISLGSIAALSVAGHLDNHELGSSPYSSLRLMPSSLSLPHPVLSSVYL